MKNRNCAGAVWGSLKKKLYEIDSTGKLVAGHVYGAYPIVDNVSHDGEAASTTKKRTASKANPAGNADVKISNKRSRVVNKPEAVANKRVKTGDAASEEGENEEAAKSASEEESGNNTEHDYATIKPEPYI